ncbi:MAG: SIS domain-containing protein [Cyclobacteriaceae bacterium]|nr:SIS domain-containing protein [Cyclobacteriaceae bacterium]
MNNWLNKYMDGYKKSLESIPLNKIHSLIEEFAKVNKLGKQIFIFGNGGSASNASHFVTDMAKGASDKLDKRFKCYSLNEHMSLITAISNDYSYKDIYKRQMENFASEGDLLFTLSVSGNSPNLVEAVKWANENGLHTIAMVGGAKGQLAELAKEVIIIDSTHYGHVEDIHMLICHMIAYAFMENPDYADSL